MRRLSLLLALAFLLSGCTKQGTPEPNPDSTNGDFDLDPETTFEGYAFRAPQGYTTDGPNSIQVWKYEIWVGKERGDGTKPGFKLWAGPLLPNLNTAELLLAEELDAQKKLIRQRWTQTPSETIKSNGLSFLRARWTGERDGREQQGFVMVALDGNRYVQFSSYDNEPNHEATLKIAEAAAMTLRKK